MRARHLLLYDGVCGLCDRLVQFVLAHDPGGVFDFAPLQSATGRAAVSAGRRRSRRAHVVLCRARLPDPQARSLVKARAALFVARSWAFRGTWLRSVGVLPTAAARLGLRRRGALSLPRLRPLRSVRAPAARAAQTLCRLSREDAMKIVIPGGSGQVGTVLARAFTRDGHEVVVLSRRPRAEPWRTVAWDGVDGRRRGQRSSTAPTPSSISRGAASTAGTPPRTAGRSSSRVCSRHAPSAQAIAASARPPRVWLQASTATIYAHRYDAANDERSGIIGGDEPGAPETWRFSIDVARAWERASRRRGRRRRAKSCLRSADHDEPGSPAARSTCSWASCGAGSAAPPATAGSSCRGSTTRISSRPSAG